VNGEISIQDYDNEIYADREKTKKNKKSYEEHIIV
jgi:hypothetical protein